MRVLVTASRDWTDVETIRQALVGAHSLAGVGLDDPCHPDATLVTGGCPKGGDAIAERIWSSWGLPVERHPARWSEGLRAGPRRNRRMVATGADLCLAFIKNGSRGASGTAELAEHAGIPTLRYESWVGFPAIEGEAV